jgi:carotenoid cleavage dioxygenase-like enzyme
MIITIRLAAPPAAAQQRLDDRPQESPRTDERVAGQPHRHGYSAVIAALGHATISPGGDFADEAFSNALLKHDLTAAPSRPTNSARTSPPESRSST